MENDCLIKQETIQNCLKFIRLRTLEELRGKFSIKEWIFLADILNGLIIDNSYRFSPEVLVATCEDAELYENKASYYSVCLPELIEKLKLLSITQLDALYYRIENFWENCSRLDMLVWAQF